MGVRPLLLCLTKLYNKIFVLARKKIECPHSNGYSNLYLQLNYTTKQLILQEKGEVTYFVCRCSTAAHYSEYEQENRKSLELSTNKVYNQGMNTSGAIFGAWNDDNDPYYRERDRHAKLYYDEVRNRDKTSEVSRVAQNTDFTPEEISKIYDHIFINEHELEGGRRRFDANYDMAESWRRLSETGGKNIQEHDLIMLNHELMESELMEGGLSYVEAHLETDKKYNYQKAWIKWATEKGDL